ncbi:MAG: aldo/keto reductase, partial [Dechloromonas sp.]|nr:aldo/keto reductase [Dechloromonas sp.]
MNEQISSRRRDLLKASATVGAAVYATPLMMGAASAQQTTATSSASGAMDLPNITKRRTLGSGDFRMEVSALGFGVMGMNYNRGHHPDRKAMIELLHQAAERGVTLFDTAQVYGPLINEELAGEGLYPYRNKVNITTKFGHRVVNGKYIHGELDSTPQNIRRV